MPKSASDIWREHMERKLKAAAEEARPLLASGRYDEAERLLTAIDSDLAGSVAIARMYKERLRELAGGRRAVAEEVYRRALRWAQGSYPEPHTQIEADDYNRGRAEDHAELVNILGYDPDAQSRATG